MKFEWDENKRLQNRKIHGVDFIVMASRMFDGRPVSTRLSPRSSRSLQ
jgi:uncharacterized DUF497 family protein